MTMKQEKELRSSGFTSTAESEPYSSAPHRDMHRYEDVNCNRLDSAELHCTEFGEL